MSYNGVTSAALAFILENDGGTHYFEITTFIRTVLWPLKGTAKMEW